MFDLHEKSIIQIMHLFSVNRQAKTQFYFIHKILSRVHFEPKNITISFLHDTFGHNIKLANIKKNVLHESPYTERILNFIVKVTTLILP